MSKDGRKRQNPGTAKCCLDFRRSGHCHQLSGITGAGGLAQYTLACLGPFPTLISMVGGYLICNIMSSGVEASIFSYAMASTIHLPIPSILYTLVMTVVVMIANLYGVDMFAKIQDLVAFLLVGSMLIMGIIGMFGLGTGAMVQQPYNMAADWKEVVSMVAVAFWLFIGAAGKIWMTFVAALAVVSTQNSTVNGLAGICQGMAKMNMMPRIFAKTNKHGVPFFGVILSAFSFSYLQHSVMDPQKLSLS